MLLFYSGADKLARAASLPRRSPTQPAVQIPRQIDARADAMRLHRNIVGDSTYLRLA